MALPVIEVFPNTNLVSHRGAEIFTFLARSGISERGVFRVALAGGNTPKEMYACLTEAQFNDQIQWNKVEIFWSDERLVPRDHPSSNFRMVKDTLLEKISIPEANIYSVAAGEPYASAVEYEKELARVFGVQPPDFPSFDLIILGMGIDGHTASLFPGSPSLSEKNRWVSEVFPVPETSPTLPRVTFTVPLILNAKQIIVLVTGQEKAKTLREVLYGEYNPLKYPVQFLLDKPGTVHWLLDSFAASNISTILRNVGRTV